MKNIIKNKFLVILSIAIFILICGIFIKGKNVLKVSFQNMINYLQSSENISKKIKENTDSINNMNNTLIY